MLIELPSVEQEHAALLRASSRGIKVETLSRHTLPGYKGPAGLLIGVGGLPDGAIPYVVADLARALAAVGALPAAA
jgi:hypothetical protein